MSEEIDFDLVLAEYEDSDYTVNTIHLEPGVYFGLADETYHQLPYLSATGIKRILISDMDFWSFSWMNPLKPERNSEAMTVGKAYHKRILEGYDAYLDAYCPEFDPSPYRSALETNDQIKAILKMKGQPVGGNKPELKERLRRVMPDVQFIDEVRQNWLENEANGRIPLNRRLMAKIEISAAMIEKHPELSKCFSGGMPEVTIIWEEDGVRFKARLDYLKFKAIVDYKTFGNMMEKPIDQAIYYAMASRKYHIQAAMYMKAMEQAVQFIRRGQVHGFAPKEFLSRVCQVDQHDFYFVFQQTGPSPVARGKKFPRAQMYGCGLAAIEDATKRYKKALRTFGTDTWVDMTPIDEFEDERFPIWATEL